MEKKKIVTGKTFAKILGITVGGFFGVFALVVGVMYFCGAFDEKIVLPTNIAFELNDDRLDTDAVGTSYYSPQIFTLNEDGTTTVADYFLLDVNAINEDATATDLTLSVSNSDVIRLEKSKITLGEQIKVFVCKNALGVPYGGYATIVARSNGGINGTAKINIFIDVPVKSVEIVTEKTSKNPTSLFQQEIMTLKQPSFYPAKSLNPSLVNEGTSPIVKGNKQYTYKVEFKVITTGATGQIENWVDLDSSDTLNNAQNRVVNWVDSKKTQLQALKLGQFRVKAYAFDTYEEQEKEFASEQEYETLERMRAVSDYTYYTITEVEYVGIDAQNYSSNEKINFEYKKQGMKVYLRTPKTPSQLASEGAINFNVKISPNSNYGISAENLYDKVANVFITTNLNNAENFLNISGIEKVLDDGTTRIYPFLSEGSEYEADALKEYYYIIDVIGQQNSDFNVNLNIENPNTKDILTTTIRAEIKPNETSIFGFEKVAGVTDLGHYDKLELSKDGTTTKMDVLIETSTNVTDNYINLPKFIVNRAENGKEPTFNKIKYYVYIANNPVDFDYEKSRIARIVQIPNTTYTEILPNVLCLEIEEGRLIPISFGTVKIYAVLIKTDMDGNELINVNGTTTYRECSMEVNIDIDLKAVNLDILTEDFTELEEDFEIKENYSYNLIISASLNDIIADKNIIENNINNLQIVPSTNQVIIDGIITYDEENEKFYVPIKVLKLQEIPQPISFTCLLAKNGTQITIGESDEYHIKKTAVESLEIQNEDATYTASWSGEAIVWRGSNNQVVVGGKITIRVAIVGENKNFELQTSDSSAIKVSADNQSITLQKPVQDVITITAISLEDSTKFDSFQITLRAEDISFHAVQPGFEIQDGEIMYNNVVYNETVYKGDTVDLLQRIQAKNTGNMIVNGLLSFYFETSCDFAKFNENNPSEVIFLKNVNINKELVVVIESKFGQLMRYRFTIKNYLTFKLNESVLYNNTPSTEEDGTSQNRVVMSSYNNEEYMTFVWSRTNTASQLDLKDVISIETVDSSHTPQEGTIVYDLQSQTILVSLSRDGILKARGSENLQVSSPTVIRFVVKEIFKDDEGVEQKIYEEVFQILLVPDLLVEQTTNAQGNPIYLAGQYKFVANETNTYNLDANNLSIPLNEVFVNKDFFGKDINNPAVVYFEGQRQLASNEFDVETNKVFATTIFNIKQRLTFNGKPFESTAELIVNPYYELYLDPTVATLVEGTTDTIEVCIGQSVNLGQLILIRNSTFSNNVKCEIKSNNGQYISLQNLADTQRVQAERYSGNNVAEFNVKVNNEISGFVLKVKVLYDIGVYKVNEPTVTSVNSISTISLVSKFVAKRKTDANANVDLIYSIKKALKDNNGNLYYVDYETNETPFAYINNKQVCFNPCAETQYVAVLASPLNMEGLEPLVCYFEINPSQRLEISYKYSENNILDLNSDLYEGKEHVGYIEVKPYDKIMLTDYIRAFNVENGVDVDIFKELTLQVEEFDIMNKNWLASNKYQVYAQSTNAYIQPAGYSEPTFTRIKIESDGGLIGYFNVLLATQFSVRSKENVSVNVYYPVNSSNYFADSQTYECVNNSEENEVIIPLIDVYGNNQRRIYAEFNQQNVSNELVFNFTARTISDGTNYIGGGITIEGKNLRIGSGVPKGTAITISMHNSYCDFDETYNVYVGGNVVVNFKHGTQSEDANAVVQYNVSSNNIINLSNLFTITDLAGDDIDLVEGGKATLTIENNTVTSNDTAYVFARIITQQKENLKVYPVSIRLSNYANQNGSIAEINIKVFDEFDIETNATFRLKVLPSAVAFTNPDGSLNTEKNPLKVRDGNYTLYSEASEASGAVDLINSQSLLTTDETSSISDISLSTLNPNISISGLGFSVVHKDEIMEETLATIQVQTIWGRTVNYYVLLLPQYKLEKSDVFKDVENVYSGTELNLFKKADNSTSSINLYQYNESTKTYEKKEYDSDIFEISVYQGETALDLTSDDSLVKINADGSLAFGIVSTNVGLRVEVCLKDDNQDGNNQVDKYGLISINVVLMPNFNSDDVAINVNGRENSQDNPIHLTEAGVSLTSLIQIDRFVNDNISTNRFPNGVSSIVSSSDFISEEISGTELLVVENNVVKANPNYYTDVDVVATLTMMLMDGEPFKTIYFLIEANFSFNPVKELTVIYDNAPLSYISDYFVGSDGNSIVGGTLTFKGITNQELFTIEDNVLTITNKIKTDTVTPLLVIYEVGEKKYISSINVVLKPEQSIEANYEEIILVSSAIQVNKEDGNITSIVVDGNTMSVKDFVNAYFTCYEADVKITNMESATIVDATHDVNGTNIYEIKATFGNSASVFFQQNENAYSYSALDVNRFYIAGEAINLLTTVGEFYNSSDEVIEPKNSLSYSFICMENQALVSDYIFTPPYSTTEKVYTIIVTMRAINGVDYMAKYNLTVYPSVLINLTYTQRAQNITLAKAGSTLSLKDYISFNPQSNSLKNEVLNNESVKYDYFVYDQDGKCVFNSMDNSAENQENKEKYCVITGIGENEKYQDINPKLEIKLESEGFVIILKPSMRFTFSTPVAVDETLETYYYIKVEGVSYNFANNETMPSFKIGDQLSLSQLGAFSIGDIPDAGVTFKAIGEYYTLNDHNEIASSANIYDIEVEVLIKALYEGVELYAISSFILKTSYEIDNVVLNGEYATNFEHTVTSINLLDSQFVNLSHTSMRNFVKQVDIKLYDEDGEELISSQFSEDGANGYFSIDFDNNSITFTPTTSDEQTFIKRKIRIQLKFESVRQFKNLQYNVTFKENVSQLIASVGGSGVVNLSPSDDLDLGNVTVKLNGETLSSEQYNFEFSLSNEFCYIDSNTLYAKPYFSDGHTTNLYVVVKTKDEVPSVIGQSGIQINLQNVSFKNENGIIADLSNTILYPNGEVIYDESLMVGENSLHSACQDIEEKVFVLYSNDGEVMTGNQYTDYLTFAQAQKKFTLKNVLIYSDIIVQVSTKVELRTRNGQVTDYQYYKMTILIPSNQASIYLNGAKVQNGVDSVYNYQVNGLSTVTVTLELNGSVLPFTNLELLTTDFASAVSIVGNAFTINALYENATASILIKNEAYNVSTVLNIVWPAFTFSNDLAQKSLSIVCVEDVIPVQVTDIIQLYDIGNKQICDNATANAYQIVGNSLRVLKFDYYIVIKSKANVNIQNQDVHFVTIYKTVEYSNTYLMTINNSPAVLEMYTTDNLEPLPIVLTVGNEVKTASYQVLDVVNNTGKDDQPLISLQITSNNELALAFVSTDYTLNNEHHKTVSFVLRANYGAIYFEQQFLINLSSPFIFGDYSFEFNLKYYYEYEYKNVIHVNDLISQTIRDGVNVDVLSVYSSNSEKLYYDSDNGDIYAYVPKCQTLYGEDKVTIVSEEGYEAVITFKFSYNGEEVGQSVVNVTVQKHMQDKEIRVDTFVSVDGGEDVTIELAGLDDGGIGLVVLYANNTEILRGPLNDIESCKVTYCDVSPGNSYSTYNVLYHSDNVFRLQLYHIDYGTLTDRSLVNCIFTVSGMFYTSEDQIEESRTIALNIMNSEFLHEAGINSTPLGASVEGTKYLETSNYKNSSNSISESQLKAEFAELNGYDLSFIKIDDGYSVSGNEIYLEQVENSCVVNVKVLAQKNEKTEKVYYLAIARDGNEPQLQHIKIDDVATFNGFSNADESWKRNKIKEIINDEALDPDGFSFKQSLINGIIMVTVTQNVSTNINATWDYYMLEIGTTSYNYYTNKIVTFGGATQNRLVNITEIIPNAEINTTYSCVWDEKYNQIISFNSTDKQFTILPVLRDVVIPVTIVAKNSGEIHYHNVNLVVRKVADGYLNALKPSLGPSQIKELKIGNELTLPTPSFAGYNATWSLSDTSDITFENNKIETDEGTEQKTICATLTISPNYVASAGVNYGEYTFTYFIKLVKDDLSAVYEQSVYTIYAGQEKAFNEIGSWIISSSNADYVNYTREYSYGLDGTITGVSIENNILQTTVSLVDKSVEVICTITLKDVNQNIVGSFTANITITVLSGISFVSGGYSLVPGGELEFITSTELDKEFVISELTFELVVDSEVATFFTQEGGSLVVTLNAQQSSINVTVKVKDKNGVVKAIALIITIAESIESVFEYTAPTSVEFIAGTSRTLTASVDDIGTFKRLTNFFEESILNEKIGYDFIINYSGTLLQIQDKTIYAREVLDVTTEFVQIILYNMDSTYIGNMVVTILPRYEFRKTSNKLVYGIEAGSSLNVAGLVDVYRDGEIVNYEDKNISLAFEFVLNGDETAPQIEPNSKEIFFDYEFANRIFNLRVTYSYQGSMKEIYCVISVGVISYTAEIKTDILSFHSGQAIDLSKLTYVFLDEKGQKIETNNLVFLTLDETLQDYKYDFDEETNNFVDMGQNNKYVINPTNKMLTIKDVFETTITRFGVKFGQYLGEVTLTINSTYALEVDELISVYATNISSVDCKVKDTYRNQYINLLSDNKFDINLMIDYGDGTSSLVDYRSFVIDHKYANQTLNATISVLLHSDEPTAQVQELFSKQIRINVLPSRFLKLNSSGIKLDYLIATTNGESIFDLVTVVDENGNTVANQSNDYVVSLVNDSVNPEQKRLHYENGMLKLTNANQDEMITIVITYLISNQSVEYTCIVS